MTTAPITAPTFTFETKANAWVGPGRVTFICPYWKELRPWNDIEREENTASIEQHGVLTPIHGVTLSQLVQGGISISSILVIDGYHRTKTSHEKGLPPPPVHFFPTEKWESLNDKERRKLAVEVNEKQRHETPEERAARAVQLRKEGQSYRAIGEKLGVDKETARQDVLAATVENPTVELPTVVKGKDNRTRQAKVTPNLAGAAAEELAPTLQESVDRAATKLQESAGPSGPARRPGKMVRVKCPQCRGAGLQGKSPRTWACLLCNGACILTVELVPSEANGNGTNQDWNTPPSIVDPARLIDWIALDPTHNAGSIWKAAETINEQEDGLAEKWSWVTIARGGLIAVNPPWSNMLPFVDRMVVEASYGAQQLLIGPAGNPSSEWYQKALRSAPLRIDPTKRICYLKEGKEETSPRDSTVLFYWGKNIDRVCAIFGEGGLDWFVSHRKSPEEYRVASVILKREQFDARQAALPRAEPPGLEAPKLAPEIEVPEPTAELKEEPAIEEAKEEVTPATPDAEPPRLIPLEEALIAAGEPDTTPPPSFVCLVCGEPFWDGYLWLDHSRREHGKTSSTPITIDGRSVCVTSKVDVSLPNLRAWLFGGAEEVWIVEDKKSRLLLEEPGVVYEIELGEVYRTRKAPAPEAPGVDPWLQEAFARIAGTKTIEECRRVRNDWLKSGKGDHAEAIEEAAKRHHTKLTKEAKKARTR